MRYTSAPKGFFHPLAERVDTPHQRELNRNPNFESDAPQGRLVTQSVERESVNADGSITKTTERYKRKKGEPYNQVILNAAAMRHAGAVLNKDKGTGARPENDALFVSRQAALRVADSFKATNPDLTTAIRRAVVTSARTGEMNGESVGIILSHVGADTTHEQHRQNTAHELGHYLQFEALFKSGQKGVEGLIGKKGFELIRETNTFKRFFAEATASGKPYAGMTQETALLEAVAHAAFNHGIGMGVAPQLVRDVAFMGLVAQSREHGDASVASIINLAGKVFTEVYESTKRGQYGQREVDRISRELRPNRGVSPALATGRPRSPTNNSEEHDKGAGSITQGWSSSREKVDGQPAGVDVLAKREGWHGSPHRFDKFTTAKMGTGEGAQAYGWGMYFAGAREVAEWYRNTLGKAQINPRRHGEEITIYKKPRTIEMRLPEGESRKVVINSSVGSNVVSIFSQNQFVYKNKRDADFIKKAGMPLVADFDLPVVKEHIAKFWDVLQEGGGVEPTLVPGAIYRVDLKPDEADYLDWDKPLSDANRLKIISQGIAEELQYVNSWDNPFSEIGEVTAITGRKKKGQSYNFKVGGRYATHYLRNSNTTYRTEKPYLNEDNLRLKVGEDVYRNLTKFLGTPQAASEFLFRAGVRGNKYLDGSSRIAGEGEHNYVIFNDTDVDITEVLAKRRTRGTELQLSSESALGEVAEARHHWYNALPAKYKAQYDRDVMGLFHDEKGQNILGKILGLKVVKTFQGVGVFNGVTTPLGSQTIIRVPVDPENRHAVHPKLRPRIDAMAAAMGAVMQQDGMAWNQLFLAPSKQDANILNVAIDRKLTEAEMQPLDVLVTDEGVKAALVATEKGVRILHIGNGEGGFIDGLDNATFIDRTTKATDTWSKQQGILHDAQHYFADTNYLDWSEYESYIQGLHRSGDGGRLEEVRQFINGQSVQRESIEQSIERVSGIKVADFDEHGRRAATTTGDTTTTGGDALAKRRVSSSDLTPHQQQRQKFRAEPEAGLPSPAAGDGDLALSKRYLETDETFAALLDEYNQTFNSKPFDRHIEYVEVPEDMSRAAAELMDDLPHAPEKARVKAAYDSLLSAVARQYKFFLDKGYKFEAWTGAGEPYANSAAMIKDVRENKHLYYEQRKLIKESYDAPLLLAANLVRERSSESVRRMMPWETYKMAIASRT